MYNQSNNNRPKSRGSSPLRISENNFGQTPSNQQNNEIKRSKSNGVIRQMNEPSSVKNYTNNTALTQTISHNKTPSASSLQTSAIPTLGMMDRDSAASQDKLNLRDIRQYQKSNLGGTNQSAKDNSYTNKTNMSGSQSNKSEVYGTSQLISNSKKKSINNLQFDQGEVDDKISASSNNFNQVLSELHQQQSTQSKKPLSYNQMLNSHGPGSSNNSITTKLGANTLNYRKLAPSLNSDQFSKIDQMKLPTLSNQDPKSTGTSSGGLHNSLTNSINGSVNSQNKNKHNTVSSFENDDIVNQREQASAANQSTPKININLQIKNVNIIQNNSQTQLNGSSQGGHPAIRNQTPTQQNSDLYSTKINTNTGLEQIQQLQQTRGSTPTKGAHKRGISEDINYQQAKHTKENSIDVSDLRKESNSVHAGLAQNRQPSSDDRGQSLENSQNSKPVPIPAPAPVPTVIAPKHCIVNYAVKSKAGITANKQSKTNQDSYIVIGNYTKTKNRYLFAVCDGHGVNGHFASQFVKKALPINLQTLMKLKFNGPPSNDSHLINQSFRSAFAKTNQDLLSSGIDVNFSGSTTVCVYVHENTFYCGNVGDSRAIIATSSKSNPNILQVNPLSIDQKPDNELEYQRIMAEGGRVQPFRDMQGNQMGPYRVWLQTENIPGLAMARSFGDYVASQVGVISDPEVFSHQLSEDDQFMVVASDGLWEFISSQQVVEMVVPFYAKNDPDGACEQLLKEAILSWKREDDVIDDITIIVVFFGKSNSGPVVVRQSNPSNGGNQNTEEQ